MLSTAYRKSFSTPFAGTKLDIDIQTIDSGEAR
jgi:hypothetical protein